MAARYLTSKQVELLLPWGVSILSLGVMPETRQSKKNPGREYYLYDAEQVEERIRQIRSNQAEEKFDPLDIEVKVQRQ